MIRSLLLGGVAALAISTVASAADLPVKAPLYVPVSSWTGFYVGAQVGYGWASNTTTNVDATNSFVAGTVLNSEKPSGWLGGFYGGYNYQFSNMFVIGADVDYSWANIDGGDATDLSNTGVAGGRTLVHRQKITSLTTVTGRLGYVLANNWLLFAKGGWAWAGWRGGGNVTRNDTGALTTTTSNSTIRDGFIVGGGIEWALAAHWTAKVEYDYIKFNTVDYNNTDVTPTGITTNPARSATSHMDMVKVGAAYRF